MPARHRRRSPRDRGAGQAAAGVYLEYSGTAAGAAEARNELLRNGALAAGAVIVLLILAFRSGRSAALILGAAPMALVGVAASDDARTAPWHGAGLHIVRSLSHYYV